MPASISRRKPRFSISVWPTARPGNFRVSPAAFLLVILVLLAGCQAQRDGHAAAGPVVFVDAAGNRVVVDTEVTAVGTGATAASAPVPGAPAGSVPARAPGGTAGGAEAVAAEGPALAVVDSTLSTFNGELFVDSASVALEVDRRERERFFVLPDGTGGKQTLTADGLGVGRRTAEDVLPPAPPASLRSCRVILPLLRVELARIHSLDFPATDIERRYAGFLLPVPAGATAVALWSYVRKGTRADPLLAVADGEGRVVALVNNTPTESIPESRFRYARVGGRIALDAEVVAGGFLALLDGALVRDRLPSACRDSLPPADAGVSVGQVGLSFSGNAE